MHTNIVHNNISLVMIFHINVESHSIRAINPKPTIYCNKRIGGRIERGSKKAYAQSSGCPSWIR